MPFLYFLGHRLVHSEINSCVFVGYRFLLGSPLSSMSPSSRQSYNVHMLNEGAVADPSCTSACFQGLPLLTVGIPCFTLLLVATVSSCCPPVQGVFPSSSIFSSPKPNQGCKPVMKMSSDWAALSLAWWRWMERTGCNDFISLTVVFCNSMVYIVTVNNILNSQPTETPSSHAKKPH